MAAASLAFGEASSYRRLMSRISSTVAVLPKIRVSLVSNTGDIRVNRIGFSIDLAISLISSVVEISALSLIKKVCPASGWVAQVATRLVELCLCSSLEIRLTDRAIDRAFDEHQPLNE